MTFGRTSNTGVGDNLPRGSIVLPHRNPTVSATRLLLPQIGGSERIGVFYCKSQVEEKESNISVIILAKDGKYTPSIVLTHNNPIVFATHLLWGCTQLSFWYIFLEICDLKAKIGS